MNGDQLLHSAYLQCLSLWVVSLHVDKILYNVAQPPHLGCQAHLDVDISVRSRVPDCLKYRSGQIKWWLSVLCKIGRNLGHLNLYITHIYAASAIVAMFTAQYTCAGIVLWKRSTVQIHSVYRVNI